MGRIITIALVIAAAVIGRAAGGPGDPKLPVPRPSAIADYYSILRTQPDSIPDASEALLDAGRRLALLTEQLPDSLPLRTSANTVLIVHRKNPKYRDTIDRLLWRRLDPALAAAGDPGELPEAFSRIATELRPLCGTGADTVRSTLEEIYGADYRSFLTSAWPARESRTASWIASILASIGPCEAKLLVDLSLLLAVPLADSSRVRILVIPSHQLQAVSVPVLRDGRATIIVSTRSVSTREGVVDLLCGYLRACDSLAPEGTPSMVRLLSAEHPSGGVPRRPPGLEQSLLRYAVSLELQRTCGWDGFLAVPTDSSLAASFRKNWDVYVAGGIPLPTAVAAIVSEASAGVR
jgi:hypothetical protein